MIFVPRATARVEEGAVSSSSRCPSSGNPGFTRETVRMRYYAVHVYALASDERQTVAIIVHSRGVGLYPQTKPHIFGFCCFTTAPSPFIGISTTFSHFYTLSFILDNRKYRTDYIKREFASLYPRKKLKTAQQQHPPLPPLPSP